VIVRLNLFFPAFSLAVIAILSTAAHALSGSSTKTAEEAGAVLFRDKGCPFCHGTGGEGTKKAPSLIDLRKDKDWPPDKITNQILNGGQKMPPFRDSLTDDEIAQLVSYLRARHRPEPPPPPTPPSN
jgi:nicotinate dehydrogenase subunit B